MRLTAAALLGWVGLLAAPACGSDDEPTTTGDAPPTTAAAGLSVEGTEEAAFATQFATVAAGDAWMPNPDDGQVTRVDGGTGEVVAEIPVGDPDALGFNPDPQSVTSDPEGQVWAGVFSTDSAERIDPGTNRVVESVLLGIDPYGLVVTETDIWATDFEEGLIIRVDRASGIEVARLEELASPTAVLHAHDAIWVAHHRSGRVIRIDPATNTVTGSSETRGTVEGMIAFADAVWVASNSGRAIKRIDPDSLEVASIPLGANAYGISAGPDGLWATTGPQDGCDDTNSALVLIDPGLQVEQARIAIECAFAVAALPDGLVLVGVDAPPPRLVSVRWRG